MTDCYPEKVRSQVMRAVKSHGNKTTELRLIRLFREKNIRGWRRNYKLFGRPDFVFPKKRVVVFADGCFWHGHDCRNVTPRQNFEYWQKKILKNKKRDKMVVKNLKIKRWLVFRIYECQIKKNKIPGALIGAVNRVVT